MRRFHTIMVDPPWPERGSGRVKRGADRHYKTLPVRDIPSVILRSELWLPHRDAHLYLWVTNNYLPDGCRLVEALGFRYVTCITWEKVTQDGGDHTGLGQYFRGQTEHMLFGVRGNGYAVRTKRRDLRSLLRADSFKAPVGEHSEKPPEAFDLVERRSRGPYLEVFSRRRRPRWTSWGDEVRAA